MFKKTVEMNAHRSFNTPSPV